MSRIDEIRARLAEADANPVPIYSDADAALRGNAEDDIRWLLEGIDTLERMLANSAKDADRQRRWAATWKQAAKREREWRESQRYELHRTYAEIERQKRTIGRLVGLIAVMNIISPDKEWTTKKLKLYGLTCMGGRRMTELKPCPFCGSETVDIARTELGETWGQCANCLACGPVVGAPYEVAWEDASTAWNTRAGGWIKVNDGLPEDDRLVLIRTDANQTTVGRYFPHPIDAQWGSAYNIIGNVIYWKELEGPNEIVPHR